MAQIRVGRRKYIGKNYIDPSFPGFLPILVLTKSSKYGSLGPYVLKNEKGQIIENIWQYSKTYAEVPATTQTYSRWDNRIIWNHPAEVHVKDGIIQPEYWNWRNKGINAPDAIRYPVGLKHRHKCLGSFIVYPDNTCSPLLNYVDARKQIYLPEYCQAVKKERQFQELQSYLKQGKNLLIIEVDGPHQESLDYYKEKHRVGDDFIINGTILVTERNIQIMLTDTKHAFGHGYCLAMALLGKDVEWNK